MLILNVIQCLTVGAIFNAGKGDHDMNLHLQIGRLPTPPGDSQFIVLVPESLLKAAAWEQGISVIREIVENDINKRTGVVATVAGQEASFAGTNWGMLIVNVKVGPDRIADIDWVARACRFLEETVQA